MPRSLRPVLLALALTGLAAAATGIPEPDLSALEADVRTVLQSAHRDLNQQLADVEIAAPVLARSFGSLGRLYQAHLLNDAAAACFRRAAELAPDDFQWSYHLGHVHEVDGHLDQSIQGYERALVLDSGSALIRLRLGRVLLQAGELDRAETLLRQAAEQPALQASALYELGKLAFSRADYPGARDHLERALALQPAANRLHYTLALVFRAEENVPEARRHLALRGDVEPAFPDPLVDPLQHLSTGQRMLFHMGMNAANQGDYKTAATWFGAGLAENPDNEAARVSLARFLFLAGDIEAAEKTLKLVPPESPESVLAALLLGVLQQDAGDSKGAVARYQQGLAQQPDHPGLNYFLANVLYNSGRYAEAAAAYQASLRQADGNAGAWFWGIVCAIRSATSPQELGDLTASAHRRHPENSSIAYLYAAMLAAAPDDDLRNGIQALTLARELHGRHPSVEHEELLAMALAETGDFEAAIAMQESALAQARALWRWDLIDRLETSLEGYRRREACRSPWSENSLNGIHPPFDPVKVFKSYPTPTLY